MLVTLFEWLSQYYSGFSVFQYITLRAILGILTALAISLVFGSKMIRALKKAFKRPHLCLYAIF